MQNNRIIEARTPPSFSISQYGTHTGIGERAGMRDCVRQWLMTNIAAVLEIDADSIDVHRNLDELGLDSLQAVCLAGDLEAWLGLEISETALWDYPTIDSMCDYIMRKIPAAAESDMIPVSAALAVA